MSIEIISETRKNTVQFVFENGPFVKPKESEMISFTVELGLKASDVHTLYKDPVKRIIYSKFNDKDFCDSFSNDHVTANFKYENGVIANVTISKTHGMMKYIRTA